MLLAVWPSVYFLLGGGGGGGGGFTLDGDGGFELTPLLMCCLGGRGGGGFEPFLPIALLPGFFHKFNHIYFFNIYHY